MNPKQASWHRVAAAAVLLAALSPLPLAAQETGGAPGDWLSHYAGARTVGLGGAFVAVGDNAFGALWNPANLSLLYQNELLAETSRLASLSPPSLAALDMDAHHGVVNEALRRASARGSAAKLLLGAERGPASAL